MAGESFRIVSGNAAGTQIQLEAEFQIGRAAPTEGRLGDDPELSRAHAKVYRDPQGRIVIEDLGSTNGTAVNGQRISGPTLLNPGDSVQVGKSTLTLQGGGDAPGATKLGAPAGAAAAAVPPPPPPPPAVPAPAAPFAGPTPGALGAPGPAPAAGGGNRNLLYALLGLLAVAGVVLAIVLLGGGSSDSEGDDDVRAALSSFIEDPSCNDVTDSAVERVFGGDGACSGALPDGVDEGDYTISSISVDGDQADAEVDSDEDVDGDWELEQDGGDWKIDSVPAALAQTATDTGATPTPAPEPTTTEEEDPRRIEAIATLEALIQAVKDDDEKVFCGLLSPRQAQKLVGGAGGDAAIARCVEIAARVDLSKNVPSEISITGVRVSGNQASVRLTTGERFTLVRRRGRFVIDSGLG